MENKRIGIGDFKLTDEMRSVVNDILDRNWITESKYVKKFEEDFANYIGVKHCIAVNSGTSALMVALLAYRYKFKLNHVSVTTTALTFPATLNSILTTGFTAQLCDVKKDFLIDVEQLEKSERTDIIMPVHLFGYGCDMDSIMKIANKRFAFVIEDCCLVKNTPILCENKIKNIQDIEVGDKVLTHKGNYEKVINTFKREINEEILEINFYYNRLRLRLTKNHPIFILRNNEKKWIKVGDININDRIIFSKPNIKNYELKEFKWLKNKQNYPNLFEEAIINEDFFKFIGLFIAEGHTRDTGIVFTLNKERIDLRDFIIRTAKKIFNRKCYVFERKDCYAINVYMNGRTLKNKFDQLFGKYAKNKRFPEEWLGLKDKYLYSLLDGYLQGDGYIRSNRLTLTTASKELHRLFFLLFIKLGGIPQIYRIPPRKSIIRGRKVISNEHYIISIQGKFRGNLYDILGYKNDDINKPRHSFAKWDERYIYVPIISLKTELFNGYVYNIEVEKDNSYSTFMCTLHNCEATGTFYGDKRVGSIGNIGCHSFYVSHLLIGGEMGAITTNDDEIARLCRSIKNHGRVGSNMDFDHHYIGYNMKTTEFCAGLVWTQIKYADDIIKQRANNVLFFNDNIKHPMLILPKYDSKVSYLGYPIIAQTVEIKAKVVKALNKNGIETRGIFPCLTNQVSFASLKFGIFPKAAEIEKCGFYIPVHQHMTEDDKQLIVEVINQEK